MKRLITWLALSASLLAGPVISATDKPLVIKSGQVQQIPATDTLILPAATTANASINLPHGTAPTSPNNGDCWTTTTGLYCRINGATSGPFIGSGGASPGGTSGQIQYNNAGAFGGFTAGGDCTFSVPNFTCSKTGGTSFGYFATGTDATNLTGTVSVNRFNSGTGATSTTYLSGSGTWTTPAGAGTVTTTGSPASGNLTKFSGAASITNADLTGDVTTSGGVATTIATNAVSFAKFAQGATNTVVANATSGTANFAAFAMPSCSANTTALGWLTNSGFQCTTLAAAGVANPVTVGSITIEQGGGAPSSTTRNKGSLYIDVSTPAVWQAVQPSSAGPAYVQRAINVQSYAVTLGTAPTAGNVLWGFCFSNSGSPTASAGWTSKSTHAQTGTGDPYTITVSHTVASGETTSQTPCATTGSGYGAAVVEVSGVNESDGFQQETYAVGASSTGGSTYTATATTSTTNTLSIGFGGMTNVGGAHTGTGFSGMGGSAWSNVTQSTNTGSVVVGTFFSASTGATITNGATTTFTGGSDAYRVTVSVLVLQPPTGTPQRWHPLSASANVQNSQSADYTLVLTDAGEEIYHPSADTTPRTWTIPANASVPYEIGTRIRGINDCSAGAITLAITSDTLVWFTAGTTGSRTIAACGEFDLEKVTATRWVLWGVGIS